MHLIFVFQATLTTRQAQNSALHQRVRIIIHYHRTPSLTNFNLSLVDL